MQDEQKCGIKCEGEVNKESDSVNNFHRITMTENYNRWVKIVCERKDDSIALHCIPLHCILRMTHRANL